MTWEAYELFKLGEQGASDLQAENYLQSDIFQTQISLEMLLLLSFPSALPTIFELRLFSTFST